MTARSIVEIYHSLTVDVSKRANGNGNGIAHRNGSAPTSDVEAVRDYVAAAIESECAAVRSTAQGGRNERLNEAAFSLGTLVGAGVLRRKDAEAALVAAAIDAGLSESETLATLASGLDAGERKPRDLSGISMKNPSGYRPTMDVTGSDLALAGLEVLRGADAAHRATDAWWTNYEPCEADLCDAFLEMHGADWRFVTMAEIWYHWNGTHWQADETRELRQILGALQDQAARELEAEAHTLLESAGDDKDIQREAAETMKAARAWKRQNRRMIAADSLARDARAIHIDALSAGNLLNLANGCLDLKSYELRPHRRDDMLTHVLPYEYDADADCPRWRRFIAEVLVDEQGRPDAELAALVQEAMGYSLTVETNLEAFFFLSGSGSNGKSTLLRTLAALLGEHLSMTLDLAALAQYGSDYRLALLGGKRVVFSTEAKTESRVADDIFRRIASGETLDARPINKAPIQIRPVAKVWWAQNAQPAVADTSDGFWRRLRLVPFRREFAEGEKDIHLADALLKELPGILNWSLEGLRRLRQAGRFTAAKQAATAAAEYRQNQNAVALWMDECTTLGIDPKARPIIHPLDVSAIGWTRASEAYENYHHWCEGNGRTPKNSTKFGYDVRNELRQRKAGDKDKNYLGIHYPFGLVAPGKTAPTKAEPPKTAQEGATAADSGDLLESLGV